MNTPTAMEPWIETVGGNQFWYTKDTTEGIHIGDISHALSHICRFTGHCNEFYSVAEHSVNVALLLPRHKQLWGLLHDASEAYLTDIASPVKQLLPEYKILEDKIMSRIAMRYGLPQHFWKDDDVKAADWAMLKSEAKELLPSKGAGWYFPDHVSTGLVPQCFSPAHAKSVFIDMFQDAL